MTLSRLPAPPADSQSFSFLDSHFTPLGQDDVSFSWVLRGRTIWRSTKPLAWYKGVLLQTKQRTAKGSRQWEVFAQIWLDGPKENTGILLREEPMHSDMYLHKWKTIAKALGLPAMERHPETGIVRVSESVLAPLADNRPAADNRAQQKWQRNMPPPDVFVQDNEDSILATVQSPSAQKASTQIGLILFCLVPASMTALVLLPIPKGVAWLFYVLWLKYIADGVPVTFSWTTSTVIFACLTLVMWFVWGRLIDRKNITGTRLLISPRQITVWTINRHANPIGERSAQVDHIEPLVLSEKQGSLWHLTIGRDPRMPVIKTWSRAAAEWLHGAILSAAAKNPSDVKGSGSSR